MHKVYGGSIEGRSMVYKVGHHTVAGKIERNAQGDLVVGGERLESIYIRCDWYQIDNGDEDE